MLNQADQAQMFVRDKQQEIDRAKHRLTVAVQLFFQTAGKGMLPTMIEEVILANLKRGAFWAVSRQLRNNQLAFGVRQVSMLVWDIVDSISCIDDATGVRWPYMTMERRKCRLNHSDEHLSDFYMMLPIVLAQQAEHG